MFRKLFMLISILALMLGTTVVAQDEEATSWVCPEGFEGQQLNIYNWSTYIAENTISDFEALCGVSITYDTFESSEAAVARLRTGNPGYDIVIPSGSDVSRLIEEELLIPLDTEQIPNLANLSLTLLDAPFDPENEYSVPYQWGTIGIGYNVTAVGEEITSWQQMLDYPESTVAWLEDRRAMLGMALILLGYDSNSTDEAEIAEVVDFMVENGSNVIYIAGDDGQELLARGEADIVVEYSGDIFQIIYECECDDYAYVIPEEGANIWVDSMVIPVGAQNPDLAHVFIDYVLDPQVGADISNYTAYATPNQASIDLELIDPELLEDPAIYPDEELMERLFWIEPNIDFEQIYNDAWDEIKILIGA